jgi:hypothetical protein
MVQDDQSGRSRPHLSTIALTVAVLAAFAAPLGHWRPSAVDPTGE